MVYPATSLHIKKYSKKDYCFIRETRDRYETIVRPHIEKNQLNPQWVYNIIDGKSEQDRIILQAEDFILLPTWTWDGKTIESMHILALVKTRDIHSIRDLRAEHIPLLQSILKQTTVGFRIHPNGFIYLNIFRKQFRRNMVFLRRISEHFFIIHHRSIIYICILQLYETISVVVKSNEVI